MKKIALVLGSLIILTILGQDVFAEEHFCKNSEPVDLEYELDYGKINAICLDEVALAIEVFIETEGEGVFTLTIPRDVFDVRNLDCSDKTFDVLGDYDDPKVLETKITKESRTIEIHLGQDVKEYLIITTDTGIMKPHKLGSECSEESFAQKEGMTGEDAKALKESLERLEKEPKLPPIRGDLLLSIFIPLAVVGIVLTVIIRMRKSH